MSNPSKRKGSLFERQVADYLAEVIPGVDRAPLRGNRDRGDIAIQNWALELKSTKTLDLAGAVDEARIEARNAKVPYFAAILKRRRKGVAEAYFVMRLADARRFLVQPDVGP